MTYGPGGTGVSTPLTMRNSNKTTNVSAASSILSSSISATSSYVGGNSADFATLLSNLALGG